MSARFVPTQSRGDVSPEQRQALDISMSLGGLPQDRHSAWQPALRNPDTSSPTLFLPSRPPEGSEDPSFRTSHLVQPLLPLFSQVTEGARAGPGWASDLHPLPQGRSPPHHAVAILRDQAPTFLTSATPVRSSRTSHIWSFLPPGTFGVGVICTLARPSSPALRTTPTCPLHPGPSPLAISTRTTKGLQNGFHCPSI